MKQVRIKNFGPIMDAVINIKAFTIFGGKNNSGKSFASRLIYSLLKSLQNDLYNQRANRLIGSLQHPSFMWEIEDFANKRKKKNRKAIQALSTISNLASRLLVKTEDLDSGDLNSMATKKLVSEIIEGIQSTMPEITSSEQNFALVEIVDQLNQYLESLRYFNEQINLPNIQESYIHHQLRENIERELRGNFQVPSMSALFGHSDPMPMVQFTEGTTKIEFTLNRQPKVSQIKINTMNSIRLYPSNCFLESPIYWKLETLFNRRDRFFNNPISQERGFMRHPISGIPDYATSLRAELTKEYTGEIAFPEILDWIYSKSVLGGKIELSSTGQLRFYDGNNHYPLQTTATGVANIGMIGLLIERKLINERTVLFIDEPECNLHTAWQVIMAELLMKLSKVGVQVIIATHSTEILKFIANCSKRDPSISDHVALNHFPTREDENQDFISQLHKLLEDLTEPYYRLFWDGP